MPLHEGVRVTLDLAEGTDSWTVSRADQHCSERHPISVDTSQHFLVVDDDADLRDLFTGMLRILGHTADEACDGVEAVAALAHGRYDFMLLDLTMPRMTGQDVLRWLAAHPEWGHGLCVAVVSAWTASRTDELLALGADAVLPKPLTTDELRRFVETGCPAT